jgi:hypothetical protein
MEKSYPNAMECPICYTNAPTYVINCGSTVEHTVCDTCEVTMRMKEPATREGRILKCPMCRVPEKVPGKRTSFSYEYELSQLYAAPMRAPVRAPVQVRNVAYDWQQIADTIRVLPLATQERYIRMYPQIRPYVEPIYDPLEAVIDIVAPVAPHRLAVESAIAQAEARIPFAAQVAPVAPVRPPRADYHAFCESGNRAAGTCPTRGKTERKCSHAGCNKFVCRSCRQCLTH